MAVRFSGPWYVEYSQCYVFDPEEEPDYELETAFGGQLNALCGASLPGFLFLMAGLDRGLIELSVELHDAEPALKAECADIVECGFEATSANLHLCEWSMDNSVALGIPIGSYIARYSIQGYQLQPDPTGATPVAGQRYHLELWPGSMSEDRVVRSTPGLVGPMHPDNRDAWD